MRSHRLLPWPLSRQGEGRRLSGRPRPSTCRELGADARGEALSRPDARVVCGCDRGRAALSKLFRVMVKPCAWRASRMTARLTARKVAPPRRCRAAGFPSGACRLPARAAPRSRWSLPCSPFSGVGLAKGGWCSVPSMRLPCSRSRYAGKVQCRAFFAVPMLGIRRVAALPRHAIVRALADQARWICLQIRSASLTPNPVPKKGSLWKPCRGPQRHRVRRRASRRSPSAPYFRF